MTHLRFAARRLRASPQFLAAAVLTLAIGMGANALMFSAVNGLVFRPLPFADAEQLAWIFARTPQAPDANETVSGDEGEALARRASPFQATAAIGDAGMVREIDGRHDRWLGIWATRSLVDVLRVAPVTGHMPAQLPPDGAPRAILLSHERWTRDFAADPSIVGRPLAFADNKHFVVAGVLPAGLEFPFARVPHKGHGAGFKAGVQDFWILAPDRVGEHPGGVMIARLAAGQTPESASKEVRAISAALATAKPDAAGRTLTVTPLREQVLGLLAPALPLLQMFSALVLLIACANLANLMLARSVSNGGDTVMRIALGAGRADLARQFAADAFLLSLAGAAGGLCLAWGGRELLALLAPRHTALISRIAIDGSAPAFLAAIALLTTVVFGVLPGLRSPHGSIAEMMETTRHTPRALRRALNGLAIIQIALSLTLLAGAATLHGSLTRLMSVDSGYSTTGVISARTLLFIGAREAQPILDGLVARLRALPQVEAVGFVHSTPLTGKWVVRDTFEIVEGPAAGVTPEMPGAFVDAGYFDVMRIPLLAGRTFDAADLQRRDYPIIINDIAARRFFPGRNPVGTRVRMTGRLREIIGVVKATRDLRLDTPPEPQWYNPGRFGSSELLVRVSGRPESHVATLRAEILRSDPRMILEGLTPLDAVVADSVLERRLASSLVSVFAGMAVLLAAVGLFGLLQFGVLRRRREFAVRTALGATRQDVIRLVLSQSLWIAVAGGAIGVAMSLAASRALERLLFETEAASVGVLSAAALVLLSVAVLAALQPAWRAATIDPVAALKND